MPTTRLTRHPDSMPGAVYNQLQAILQRDPEADRIALKWSEPLQPEVQSRGIGVFDVRLIWCPSELAVREALVTHRGPEKLVILSPLDQSQLGKDVLARLWKNEPQRINPWRTLEQLAHVQTIDPRLTRHKGRWMAEALLDGFDRFQGHIVFGEVLDLETAWQALAWGYLDYTAPSLELLRGHIPVPPEHKGASRRLYCPSFFATNTTVAAFNCLMSSHQQCHINAVCANHCAPSSSV